MSSLLYIIYLLVAVYVDDKYEYDMAIRSTHYRGPGVFRASAQFAHTRPYAPVVERKQFWIFFSNLLAHPPTPRWFGSLRPWSTRFGDNDDDIVIVSKVDYIPITYTRKTINVIIYYYDYYYDTIHRRKRDDGGDGGDGENDVDGRLPLGGRTGGGTWHDIREKRQCDRVTDEDGGGGGEEERRLDEGEK